MSVLARNNVEVRGSGDPMLFAHGFGCDQNMWRFVAPAFEARYATILFDHVGAGRSDWSSYDFNKYSSLDGYAADVIDILVELDLGPAVFVGHSVSAMIGVLAANSRPDLFRSLILIGPSPSYINDGDYKGGFSRGEIEELLESLDSNYLGWSRTMAPVIMGNADRPDLAEELTNSFCRSDPEIAKAFARTTFLTDCREQLPKCRIRSLVVQCSRDAIASEAVGQYVHRAMPDSKYALLNAVGHCPNLSAPEETVAAIKAFLDGAG